MVLINKYLLLDDQIKKIKSSFGKKNVNFEKEYEKIKEDVFFFRTFSILFFAGLATFYSTFMLTQAEYDFREMLVLSEDLLWTGSFYFFPFIVLSGLLFFLFKPYNTKNQKNEVNNEEKMIGGFSYNEIIFISIISVFITLLSIFSIFSLFLMFLSFSNYIYYSFKLKKITDVKSQKNINSFDDLAKMEAEKNKIENKIIEDEESLVLLATGTHKFKRKHQKSLKKLSKKIIEYKVENTPLEHLLMHYANVQKNKNNILNE